MLSLFDSLKRLIRNRATRAYLTADGDWGDFPLAEDFSDVHDALLACQKHGIMEVVDMVLIMGEKPSDNYDVASSLLPGHPRR